VYVPGKTKFKIDLTCYSAVPQPLHHGQWVSPAVQQQATDKEQRLQAQMKLLTSERDSLQAQIGIQEKLSEGQEDATEKLHVLHAL